MALSGMAESDGMNSRMSLQELCGECPEYLESQLEKAVSTLRARGLVDVDDKGIALTVQDAPADEITAAWQ